MSDKNTHDEFDFQDEDAFAGADDFSNDSSAAKADDAAEQKGKAKSKRRMPSTGGFSPAKIVAMVKEAPVAYGFGAVIIIVALFMLHTIMTSWSLSNRQHHAEHHAVQSQSFGMNINQQQSIPKFKPTQHKVVTKTPAEASHSEHTVVAQNNFHPMNSGGYVQMTKKDMKTLLQGFSLAEQKDINKLSHQVSQLQAQIGGNQHGSHSLKTQINDIAKQQQALANQMDSYNHYLAKISQSLTTTQAQLKLLVAERAAHATKLTLRAVVPGRAWLVNGKGATTTVVVGSELDNYGKVMRIDSKNDKVYMSSGYVFS